MSCHRSPEALRTALNNAIGQNDVNQLGKAFSSLEKDDWKGLAGLDPDLFFNLVKRLVGGLLSYYKRHEQRPALADLQKWLKGWIGEELTTQELERLVQEVAREEGFNDFESFREVRIPGRIIADPNGGFADRFPSPTGESTL